MKFYDINGLEKGNLATEEWATYDLQNPDTTRFKYYNGKISINKSLGLCALYLTLTFIGDILINNQKVIALPTEIKPLLKNGVLYSCGYGVVGYERDFLSLNILNGFIE
ncbi:MAG: hypothetical protein RR623_08495, partial [Bacilli bacterium]